MSQKDFDLLKGGKVAFTLAVLNDKGKVLSRHELHHKSPMTMPLKRR
ncbi:MAG: hypothetical protein JXO51_11455 [Candidatus Aminicenantes bacterium]|nr:hypothetical protein [Candidatus Aminicenantes bacterium]